MAPPPQRRRIEIDALFVPMPQDLIADTTVSAPAVRLWGMIFTFGWNGAPPELEDLATALGANWRSVYRWANELQQAGWIDWDQNAAIGERFTLRTAPHGDPIVTPDKKRPKKLSPRSIELSPVTEELIVVTKELSQMTISGFSDPSEMPQSEAAPYHDQNHENHEKGGGGAAPPSKKRSIAKSAPRHVNYLSRKGMFAAPEFAGLDPDAAIADFDARTAAGQTIESIVITWRSAPPIPGATYERPESGPVQSDDAHDQRGRRGSRTNGAANLDRTITPAWLERELESRDDEAV